MNTPFDSKTFDTVQGSEKDIGWSDASRIRILLVDDDELFRESLASNLADKQFDVITGTDGKACVEILQQDPGFDLVLLDWRMPQMSGIEVMQKIKAAEIDVPVVFLTAFATERNEVTAFDCGAIDFLDKSRSSAVLARRIRVLVSNRRDTANDSVDSSGVMRLDKLAVHFRVSRAYWNDELVPLTTTEFRVVQLLASRAGEDVSYRAIYDVVHGRGFVAGDGLDGYRTNVRSLIKRIRQKFREIAPEFEEIENYPGFGYRWRQRDEAPSVNGHSAHNVSGVAKKLFGSLSQLPIVRTVALAQPYTDGRNGARGGEAAPTQSGSATHAAQELCGAGEDDLLKRIDDGPGGPHVDHKARNGDTT